MYCLDIHVHVLLSFSRFFDVKCIKHSDSNTSDRFVQTKIWMVQFVMCSYHKDLLYRPRKVRMCWTGALMTKRPDDIVLFSWMYRVFPCCSVHEVMTHPSASHVIERLLSVMSDEQFDDVFTQHFKPNIVTWALHPVANYVIQKLLLNFRLTKQVSIRHWPVSIPLLLYKTKP